MQWTHTGMIESITPPQAGSRLAEVWIRRDNGELAVVYLDPEIRLREFRQIFGGEPIGQRITYEVDLYGALLWYMPFTG